jgi:RimJ/RimL family protein N-acetyltransferase
LAAKLTPCTPIAGFFPTNVVTGRTEEIGRIVTFELRADEFVVKPFFASARWTPTCSTTVDTRTASIANAPVLETARTRLREVSATDLPALEAMFADREIMAHYLEFLTPAAATNWIATHRRLYAERGFAPWTVELRDGTFVGQCGPLPHTIEGQSEVEVVCFLRRPYWRGGYSDEVGRACVRYAFERLGVPRVIALILPGNRPSIRLALRCGFRFERNLVHDGFPMALYAVSREDFTLLK